MWAKSLTPMPIVFSFMFMTFAFHLFLLAGLRVAQPCPYCFYSVVQKLVFRPARATRCPDKREIWHGGEDRRSAPPCCTGERTCTARGSGAQVLSSVPNVTFIGVKMWEYSFQNCQNFKFWPEICTSVVGTNLIHWKNARFHGRVFKMCQISRKIYGRSLRNSWKIHGPHSRYFEVLC